MPLTNPIADTLYASYDEWRVEQLTSPRFSPEAYRTILDQILGSDQTLFTRREVGRSFEGRSIHCIAVGKGTTRALLWSQMHGDEATATMAIADILNYVRLHPHDKTTDTLLSSLTLLFLPMLNPDGAARFQRRTSQGIDMNRDAIALRTPEAQILRQLHEHHKPTFGFNLHDQELSSVGHSSELTAMAVLAPTFDEKKSDNDIRQRSKQLAATLVATLDHFIPGRIARYDDTFEPRAFGDNMQRWGTSTLLIESGHMRGDPNKQVVRKLNAVGILSSLHAIATGEYLNSEPRLYESLPPNSKRAYDVIVRNVRLQHSSGATTAADLGISYQVDTHTEDTPTLVDLGDLNTFVGLREIDGKEVGIPADTVRIGKPFPWEQFFT